MIELKERNPYYERTGLANLENCPKIDMPIQYFSMYHCKLRYYYGYYHKSGSDIKRK
jgi:hypothetical protein